MKVLLTNDDGIHAPGLFALYQELKKDFEVDIVAPETEMSAWMPSSLVKSTFIGHSYHHPLYTTPSPKGMTQILMCLWYMCKGGFVLRPI